MQGLIDQFWDDQYKSLPFYRMPFNDNEMIQTWKNQGFTQEYFTGEMYDMRSPMPDWTDEFLSIFKGDHISMCFYKMSTCNIIPYHKDTYPYYKKVFNLSDTSKIHRAVIFLEDWKPGHIFEIERMPITQWKAGQYVLWQDDALHMAANLGLEPRYTVQLTFIKNDE
jgi:hypothetical protein